MNARFSDYVTSGAFNLTLTRNQISELSLYVGGGERCMRGASSALERKGLVEAIPATVEENPLHEQDDQLLEWRLTAAGAMVLALLSQAGLSNAGTDAMAREVEALRGDLAEANLRAHDAALRTRSMFARLHAAEDRIAALQAQLAGDRIPIRVGPVDPLPDFPTEDLLDPERT